MSNLLEVLRAEVYFGNECVDTRIILKWILVYNFVDCIYLALETL